MRPEGGGGVEVREATPSDRVLIRNLYPLYLHDLSAFTDLYDVDERGVFFPDYLPDWLDRLGAMTHPLVLREGGRPAGFALVGQAPYPYMSAGKDFRMCEFFVLNRARRRGVGRRAAHAIFEMFPGVWEVSELSRNTAAVSFWRAVIGEHVGCDGEPGRGSPNPSGRAFHETVASDEVVQVFDSRRRS